MTNADRLINELTDLLIENGCTVNKPAVIELAMYVIKREQQVVKDLR